jgi:hypothetical protein
MCSSVAAACPIELKLGERVLCIMAGDGAAPKSKTKRHAGFPSYFYAQYWWRPDGVNFQVLMDLGGFPSV